MLTPSIDVKIVPDTLGHSDTRITRDIYQSVLPHVGKHAGEATAKLVPPPAQDQGGESPQGRQEGESSGQGQEEGQAEEAPEVDHPPLRSRIAHASPSRRPSRASRHTPTDPGKSKSPRSRRVSSGA
ncbi:hypothetical protein OG442_18050 [Streptomyces niveus]|uniref:Integrase n=1 Tax=Streptomyces niveus TaxID=193462 RepID=A0ABZ2AF84_STRNV|nr:hypothetical protein [Streptomyces niveus]